MAGPFLKQFARRILAQSGYALVNTQRRYWQDGLYSMHSPRFRADPLFQDAYRRGVQANGHDPAFEWRVHTALWAAQTALRVSGDFVECGVNAGFISSAIMQRLSWNQTGRRFFLVDTFAGPVLDQFSAAEVAKGRKDRAREALAAGAYVTDMDRVRGNFSQWNQIEIVQGAVPDVLSALPLGEVAFLHLDLNCAAPERAALQFLWERIPRGGVVLLDDYAYYGHEAQAEAMEEVASQLQTQILTLPTGQGLLLK